MIIKYYDRKSKKYSYEKIAGQKYLEWIYSSPIGMSMLELFIKKKLFSKIYGNYCDTRISKIKINKFINQFDINTSIFEKNNFNSFNDFFIRKLKKGTRPVQNNNNILISPCDGKILAYENIDITNIIQIKDISYSMIELIKNKYLALKYNNGCCIILRLCPTDYHRFHFIDSGICSNSIKIKGSYYSVNPIALSKIKKLFCENKREISIFNSDNFKEVLYVEIGATCVGSIIQTYTPNKKVKKGEEKGYFKFGGSTVIVFFKENIVKIDDDILKQTKLGYETSVILGEKIGVKIKE